MKTGGFETERPINSPQPMELKIDELEVRKKYNSAAEIWPKDDKWHLYTHSRIAKYINRFNLQRHIGNDAVILNAGSGGVTYGLPSENMIHIDVADEKINKYPKYIVGSVEQIDLPNDSVDVCICVGSVLNYCDASKVIGELNRITKPGGLLVLEFESSASFDLKGNPAYDTDASLIETFYDHKREVIWVYSMQYVTSLLKANRFTYSNLEHFHIITPLIYKYTHNADTSAGFSFLDGLLEFFPPISKHCSNFIMTCTKQ